MVVATWTILVCAHCLVPGRGAYESQLHACLPRPLNARAHPQGGQAPSPAVPQPLIWRDASGASPSRPSLRLLQRAGAAGGRNVGSPGASGSRTIALAVRPRSLLHATGTHHHSLLRDLSSGGTWDKHDPLAEVHESFSSIQACVRSTIAALDGHSHPSNPFCVCCIRAQGGHSAKRRIFAEHEPGVMLPELSRKSALLLQMGLASGRREGPPSSRSSPTQGSSHRAGGVARWVLMAAGMPFGGWTKRMHSRRGPAHGRPRVQSIRSTARYTAEGEEATCSSAVLLELLR